MIVITCYYLHNTRTHGHDPASYAHAKDEGRTKRRNSLRVYRDRPSIYAPSARHPHLHGEQPRRRLAIVVNYQGFFCAAPSDGIYTGRPSNLSLATTSFCPDDVPPFELLVGSDKPTPTRVIRWSDDTYVMYHYAAAGHNPATLEHSACQQLDAA